MSDRTRGGDDASTQSSEVSPGRWAAFLKLAGKSYEPRDARTSGGVLERRDAAHAEYLVRGVLRRRAVLDWLIERSGAVDWWRTYEGLRCVLRIAVFERVFQDSAPDYAIGAQAVALARRADGERAAAFVNAALRKILPGLPESQAALEKLNDFQAQKADVRWSVPDEILRAFAEGYGRQAGMRAAEALSKGEAAIWVRENALSEFEDEELARWARKPLDDFPEAWLWTSREVLPWDLEAWDEGRWTVQNLAAMLAAPLMSVQPKMRVLDLCAAPGGKTGHIWERMGGRGTLIAAESDTRRLEEMKRTMERLYGEPLKSRRRPAPQCVDFESVRQGIESGGMAPFDRVLIDAPCLALGLIQRHPEIRWDDRLARREVLGETQRELLEIGAKAVAPGGRLVWATCSPTRFENELVLGEFLAAHEGWRSVEPLEALGGKDGAWAERVQSTTAKIGEGDQVREVRVLRTRPDWLAVDGFAYGVLERACPA